jgi:hypothetical protein
MVTSLKGLGPMKDYAGESQQHIQKTGSTSRHVLKLPDYGPYVTETCSERNSLITGH